MRRQTRQHDLSRSLCGRCNAGAHCSHVCSLRRFVDCAASASAPPTGMRRPLAARLRGSASNVRCSCTAATCYTRFCPRRCVVSPGYSGASAVPSLFPRASQIASQMNTASWDGDPQVCTHACCRRIFASLVRACRVVQRCCTRVLVLGRRSSYMPFIMMVGHVADWREKYRSAAGRRRVR
jgi:hypothetical protein